MKKETIGIEPETLEELATPLTRHKLLEITILDSCARDCEYISECTHASSPFSLFHDHKLRGTYLLILYPPHLLIIPLEPPLGNNHSLFHDHKLREPPLVFNIYLCFSYP